MRALNIEGGENFQRIIFYHLLAAVELRQMIMQWSLKKIIIDIHN